MGFDFVWGGSEYSSLIFLKCPNEEIKEYRRETGDCAGGICRGLCVCSLGYSEKKISEVILGNKEACYHENFWGFCTCVYYRFSLGFCALVILQ